MMTDINEPPRQQKRWPGVIFSLIIPGFGLLRANHNLRGILWFLGLNVGALIAAFLFANQAIPIPISVLAAFALVVGNLWMLRDSFRQGRMSLKLWGIFAFLLISIGILPPISRLVARGFTIPTAAMEPTLMGVANNPTPDQIIVDRSTYWFKEPSRGDLVVFKTRSIKAIPAPEGDDEIFYIKRVVGLPGEAIKIQDGRLYADGILLSSEDGIPPIQYVELPGMPSSAKKQNGAFIVGQDEYFVLGDNSPSSADSRLWGGVPKENIYGKVSRIYYPFHRFGVPKFTSE